MKISGLLILLSLGITSSLGASWDASRSPWTEGDFGDWTQPEAPRKQESWERLAQTDTPAPDLLSLPSLIGVDLLWFYQHSVSGKTGTHCPHYPSCSRYSRIAVENYGLALGVIMTAERLSRCHDDANDKGQYEWREIDDETLIWDPPQLDTWAEGEKP